MTAMTVKDLMVPLSEYATVFEDDRLCDAIVALEKAQIEFDETRYRHRAVLVYNNQRQIVGKVSQLDVLRALEPKYEQLGDAKPLSRFGLSRFGFSPQFLKTLMNQFRLWDKPLEDICRKASELKVKEFMYTPTEGEFVREDANINEAIHQLVMGHHQSLLVARDGEIVGILRLTDVFREVCERVKACERETA